MKLSVSTIVTLSLITVLAWPAWAVPGQVAYAGYLQQLTPTKKLVPYTGTVPDITFILYESLTGGAAQWQESFKNVQVDNGVFTVVLGHKSSPAAKLRTGKAYFAEIVLGNTTMTPRIPLRTVPHAFSADNCTGHITPASVKIAGTGVLALRLERSGPTAATYSIEVGNYIGSGGSDFVIHDVTNKKAPFYIEDNTPTNTLVLRNSRRVGIGTSSPAATLTVLGYSANNAKMPAQVLFKTNQPDNKPVLKIEQHNKGGNLVDHQGLHIDARGAGDGLYVANNKQTNFIVKNNGRVGVGTTAPTEALDVKGRGRFQTGVLSGSAVKPNGIVHTAFQASLAYFSTTADGLVLKAPTGAADFLKFRDQTNSIVEYYVRHNPVTDKTADVYVSGKVGIGVAPGSYDLHVNGSIGGYTTLTASDRRWKRDVRPILHATRQVCRLEGRTFDWRTKEYRDKKFPRGRQLGLIAQEVEKVVPQIVHTDADGYKSLDYAKLTPLLVEAIKEQDGVIRRQQRQHDKLRHEVQQLKVLVARLARRRR